MKQTNEPLLEIDVKGQILVLQAKIDEELEKPEDEIDMSVVDEYFKQIRELNGGAYEKSNEQMEQELKNIYRKATVKQSKTILWYLNTTGKRVAAIFLVIGLFFGLSFGIYAARTPIVEFFLNVKEKLTEVFFNEKDINQAPEMIETVYTLGYVPEGYELSKVDITDSKVNFIWTNPNETYIHFSQSKLRDMSIIDTENSNYAIIYIGNRKILYFEKFETKTYFWNTDKYAFSLRITAPISNNEINLLIESLTLYK